MRCLKTILVVSTVALAACGRSEKKQTGGLSDDLRSDLALASASLAYPDLKVISPEEQVQPATPKRANAPKRQPKAQLQAPVKPETAAPATEETKDIAAVAPQASNEPEAVVAAGPSNEPVIASPRPTPVHSGDVGDRSGPVMRGGSPGEDHCEIHDGRRRSRVGILVNNRLPPMGVPTFPGGGIPINPLARPSVPHIR